MTQIREVLEEKRAVRIAYLSLFLSLFIFGVKLTAYLITNSVAVYSDAMESIVNIISATIALIGLKVALKPPDTEHPYGHTKIEYLIAILEAVFILCAAGSIIWKAFQTFINPQSIERVSQGLFLLFIASFTNGIISLVAYRQGKRENSPILIAHAKHIFTDVLTTIGVFLSLIFVVILDLQILDPMIALFIGFNILYMGYRLVKESFNCLIDVSLPQEKVTSIKNIINETIEGHPKRSEIYDVHDFKTRRAGRKGFVEFHLTVSGDMSVRHAHDICDEIEKKISEKYKDISVTIHIEPKDKD